MGAGRIMNKKWYMLLIMLILLSSFVYAQQKFLKDETALYDLVFEVNPIDNKIYGDKWAEFDVTLITKRVGIKNLNMIFGEDGVSWSILTEPSSDYTSGITTSKSEPATTKIFLKPKIKYPISDTIPQHVSIMFRDKNTGEEFALLLKVFIVDDPATIAKTPFNITTILDENLDPKDPHQLKLTLQNNNNAYVDMKLYVQSKFYNQSSTISFMPYEKKTTNYVLEFDPFQPPAKDTLFIKGYDDKKMLFEVKKGYNVVSKTVDYKRDEIIIKKAFKTIKTINLTNTENVIETQGVLIGLDGPKILTSVSEEGVFEKHDGQMYFVIKDLTLKPNQKVFVTMTTSYVPVLILAIMAIICLFIVHMFRSPITIKKDAESIHGNDGITAIKVGLMIKNTSKKRYKNIKIIDLVPNIADVQKDYGVGTITPSKILNTKQGHIITWDIDELDPKEERIISYKMDCRLSITNGVRLMPAKVEVTIGQHRITLKSNELDVAPSKKIEKKVF